MKTCPSIKCPYRPPICITVTGHDGCQQCACEIPDEVFSLEEYVETTTGQAGTTPPLPESYTILEAAPSETSTEVFRTGSEKLQLMTKSQSDKVQRKSADKHKPIAVLSLSAETKMVDSETAPDTAMHKSFIPFLDTDEISTTEESKEPLEHEEKQASLKGTADKGEGIQSEEVKEIDDQSTTTLSREDSENEDRDEEMTTPQIITSESKVETKRKSRPTTSKPLERQTRPKPESQSEELRKQEQPKATKPTPASSVDKAMINLRKNECTKEDKAIIDKNFRTLHEFIMERAGESDIFPIVYSLDDGTLAAKCYNYKVANVNTPLSARRRCFKRYRIYDDVYYTLAYPCRKATKEDFFEHFNCLREVFLTPEYKSCLPQGFPRIIKAQNLCKMFNEILQCSSNVINENCGLNALEIQYQYLSIVVKKIRPNCHLKRVDLLKIFR